MSEARFERPPAELLILAEEEQAGQIDVSSSRDRFTRYTLGDMGLAVTVDELRTAAFLRLPYDPQSLRGLDATTIRVFWFDQEQRRLVPSWSSGINVAERYVWARISRGGTYVPIGLPRDRLLQGAIRSLAYARAVAGPLEDEAAAELTREHLAPLFEQDEERLVELRRAVAKLELDTTVGVDIGELEIREGGHPNRFPLPGGSTMDDLQGRLQELEITAGGLPEEELFRPPELAAPTGTPWASNPEIGLGIDVGHLPIDLEQLNLPWEFYFPWLMSPDWPMYQHDRGHTGRASGASSLTSCTVGQLGRRFMVNLDGPVNTKPSIVNGVAYVGTSRYGAGPGGTLYKVDLCSGCITGRFPTPADPHFYSIHGIGGSPAIARGRAYFTTVAGKVYCVDTASMTANPPHPSPVWVTDLKNPSQAKNQPIFNPEGDCWTGPVVVNNRVYVGSGEGEAFNKCWGFVWCLDAASGNVIWVFCTNKRQNINAPGNENAPNQIPQSAATPWAAAAGFTVVADPPDDGSSPWSSPAYDASLNRIYIGTGNSGPPDVAPDQRYGSGLLALDATSGAFKGFHQAQPDDSYHPADLDIDVPGAPTIFTRGRKRVVCYGSKNGSVFLLDADTLAVLGGGAQRRQLLPRTGGTGHPGNRGNPIAGVATGPGGGENKWGVMATPALHRRKGKLFVGLGGYSGAGDGTKTPFIRALDWNDLSDAWPTTLGADGVTRYSMATPPLYQRSNEAALSSPAVVNDVVFVSTTDPDSSTMRMYALDVDTGFCLWAAPPIPLGGWPYYALGPAISGEYVVQAAGEQMHIYTRPGTPWCLCCFRVRLPNWYWERIPWRIEELPGRFDQAGG